MKSMETENKVQYLVFISTAQQVVNWLLIRHFNPDIVVALTSEVARNKEWNNGIERQAKNMNIRFIELVFEDQDSVNGYKTIFSTLIDSLNMGGTSSVVWAWGGGQKPHAAALREVALDRRRTDDILAYAEGNNGQILMESETEKIDEDIDFDEILTIHNRWIRSGPETIRPRTVAPNSQEWLISFLTNDEYRNEGWMQTNVVKKLEDLISNDRRTPLQFLEALTTKMNPNFTGEQRDAFEKGLAEWSASKLTSMSHLPDALVTCHILKWIANTPHAWQVLANVLNQSRFRHERTSNKPKASDSPRLNAGVFEKIVQQRFLNWMICRGERANSVVSDYGFNILVSVHSSTKSEAEFDILILLKNGHFVSLDAKTAGGDSWREQMFGLQQAGGSFSRLYYVYPWITEDLPPPDGNTDVRKEGIRNRMRIIEQLDAMAFAKGAALRFVTDDEEFYTALDRIVGLHHT